MVATCSETKHPSGAINGSGTSFRRAAIFPAMWEWRARQAGGGSFVQAEPWLGQFGDSLLVGANRFFEPLAERRADHAHALDDQTCARR